MKTKFLNLFLRVLTLGSKFLLSVYIVKILGLEINGEYGIFVTTITLLTYVLGLDFYTYSTREILQEDESKSSVKIQNQFVLIAIIYLVIIPLISFIWFYDVIDIAYIKLFYALLIFEHISTELYRLLVIFSKPVIANLNLFLRSGIWIICLLIFWVLSIDDFKNLESILQFWLVGSTLSIVVSLFAISRLKINLLNYFTIDKGWIKNGVIIAFPFFIGTLSYKVIQFADRYMVDYFLGSYETGTYIFFANISMLIETFVQTTVVMIFSPQLVKSYAVGESEFKQVYLKFRRELILYSLLAIVGVGLLIYPLLIFVDKSSLTSHLDVFFVMVATRFAFNLSLLYHFYLYVVKKDKIIMASTLIAVAVNIGLNFLLIPIYGMMGSAIATFIGFLIILLLKLRFAKKHGL